MNSSRSFLSSSVSGTFYAGPDDIDALKARLGDRPCLVCDLDGNVLIGYRVVKGHEMVLDNGDDPKRQAIPSFLNAANLEAMASQGKLSKSIFAAKAMDVRLPANLVGLLNTLIKDGNLFRIVFLTSRKYDDAFKILKQSGIEKPEMVTMVADSGATMAVSGKITTLRALSDEESIFLDGIAEQFGVGDFGIERKGIALNIHIRKLLETIRESDRKNAEKDWLDGLEESIRKIIHTHSPRNVTGAPVFTCLRGPATLEIKIAGIDKAFGLREILKQTQNVSGIVFSGDDVCHANGTPGTDYYAMAALPDIVREFGIAAYANIHTLHPLEEDMNGQEPNMNLHSGHLLSQYKKPQIDCYLPTPIRTAEAIYRLAL